MVGTPHHTKTPRFNHLNKAQAEKAERLYYENLDYQQNLTHVNYDKPYNSVRHRRILNNRKHYKVNGIIVDRVYVDDENVTEYDYGSEDDTIPRPQEKRYPVKKQSDPREEIYESTFAVQNVGFQWMLQFECNTWDREKLLADLTNMFNNRLRANVKWWRIHDASKAYQPRRTFVYFVVEVSFKKAVSLTWLYEYMPYLNRAKIINDSYPRENQMHLILR